MTVAVLACVGVSLSGQNVSAPVPVDAFVQLADDDRFAHADVRAITQDKDGYLWFGTRLGGLVRFDGYERKAYQHDPKNLQGLGHQVIWCLLVDQTGTLWIGTEGGLSRYNRDTDTFTHFRHEPSRPESLPHDVVLCLFEDHAGRLWAGTRGGLSRMDDRERGRFTTYQRPPVLQGSASKDSFRSITEDPTTGLLWLGASDGLAAFDPRTGAFASYVTDPADLESISSNSVNKVLRAPDGVFWAFTENGLNSFRPRLATVDQHTIGTPRIEFTRYEQQDSAVLPGQDFIRDGLIDHRDRLWLATRSGLRLFDRNTRSFTSYRRRAGDPTSLSDDLTHTVFEDRTGNLWIGTYAGGVCRRRSDTKPFHVDRHIPSDPRSLSDDRITCIKFDRNDQLWVATSRGLCRRDAGGWTRFVHDPADPNSLPTDDLSTVETTPNGDLWIGTPYAGAIRFDGTRFETMPASPVNVPVPSGATPFTGRQVHSMLADKEGGVWLGCRSYGLDYVRDGKFLHYRPAPDAPTLNPLLGLLTENGDVWYATENDGLVRFSPATGTFRSFHLPRDPRTGIGDRTLQCIARDATGTLWLGSTVGLFKFDLHHERFTRQYTMADGLPNNAIMTIVADFRGHLWLGTADGLADFDPQAERCRNYRKWDGLPANTFSPRAGALGRDGRVFLGTRAGMVSFVPEQLRDNPTPPAVVITDVRWLGTDLSSAPRNRNRQWPASDTLWVAPNQLGFSIRFAALDYATPEANQYRYRLDGWDSSWTTSSARERTATYTSLRPGNYVFHVQACNADGVWNTQGARLTIVIAPQIWEQPWFHAIAVTVIAGLIGIALQWRLRSVRRQNIALETQIEQRTAELQREVSVRRHAEAELRESHEQLERRVRERTAELAATNANLEAEIGERRKVEAQLRQSQKMEAIGQLAGGVAHDFNNLLTVILGQCELVNLGDLSAEARAAAIRDITSAAQRAAKLTRQLLVFSRREPVRLAITDLSHIIAGDSELLRRLIGENIILETSLPAGPLPTLADAGMIEQLLLNLTLNARDAMPHGGRLTITADLATLTAQEARARPNAAAGTFVRIAVADTGSGIPADVLPRIFEPFFTTKERSKGTGLGLAIANSIVQQHRGWMEVESEVGRGTTFRIWLPLQRGPMVETTPEAPSATFNAAGATILLVEDEREVRDVARQVLAHVGFQVIEASCGAEALAQWQANHERISVLLTDIIMPGHPDGRELARQLQQEKPSLRVITMSGYDPDATDAHGSHLSNTVHLRKPFTVRDLVKVIGAACSRPGPSSPMDPAR